MKCRHCAAELKHSMIDLGYAPASNAYLTEQHLSKPEKYYPLKVNVCHQCWLVQTEDYTQADELFSEDYAYFSSTSTSWLAHAKRYCDDMTQDLQLNGSSMVIELASNDGYLLKNFVANGIPCLGIEPTKSTAVAAEKLGIPVLREFFSESLGQRLVNTGKSADLILGNNVYAHVPDINDFTRGMKAALKANGTITLEFPHLLNLIQQKQFDTIYHEHYSYLSLVAVQSIFDKAGLKLWHVEKLTTHGGSLRVFGCHKDDPRPSSSSLIAGFKEEEAMGLTSLSTYSNLQHQALQIKLDVMDFLVEQKRAGKTVAAYGAAAKGNTLLNYCGIHSDLIGYVCDAASAKQGLYMPGSHIPILRPEMLQTAKPDFVILLPWNLKSEITQQLSFVRDWGGQFVTMIPTLEVFN
jgi:C-methyltransferase C-terminal domain/Putative zinc binding domain/Methyltransferase domain